MSAALKIILFTPANVAFQDLAQKLDPILQTATISAVIISRGDGSQDHYEKFARETIPLIQAHDVAALLCDMPGLVPKLKADGVHLTGGQKEVSEITKKLQPDFIVGAGDLRSRHESMLRGEAGVDYVLFGSPQLDRSAPDQARDIELAQWWVETMQIDSVLFANPENVDIVRDCGSEFIALSPSAWYDNDLDTEWLKSLARETKTEAKDA